jgi:glycosyltransferase involved in cell wall biosynthesis
LKKKVLFVLSSFRAGGAERVFRLLASNFDKSRYEVCIVLLSTGDSFYSTDIPGVEVVDMKTVKASRSFFKLYSLLRARKPDVIFCTGGQINLLVGIISFLLKGPKLIARPTNQDNSKYLTLKAKTLGIFFNKIYNRFDTVVCQSAEIRAHVDAKHSIPSEKLIVIPNPVVVSNLVRPRRTEDAVKQLIVVARLTTQKGISRLLDVMSTLPANYHLSVVGDGVLKNELAKQVIDLRLSERVKMLGMINNVLEEISSKDLFVLPSFIEGFPNVAIESLSVGTPVVSFEVGGISEIVVPGFNGYIVKQNDVDAFKQKIVESCDRQWDTDAIRRDIYDRFSIEKVTRRYESLVN